MRIGYLKPGKFKTQVEVKIGDSVIIDMELPAEYAKGKVIFISNRKEDKHILIQPENKAIGDLIKIEYGISGYDNTSSVTMYSEKDLSHGLIHGITNTMNGDYFREVDGKLVKTVTQNKTVFTPVIVGDKINKRGAKLYQDHTVMDVTPDGTLLVRTPTGGGAIINPSDKTQVESFNLVVQ